MVELEGDALGCSIFHPEVSIAVACFAMSYWPGRRRHEPALVKDLKALASRHPGYG